MHLRISITLNLNKCWYPNKPLFKSNKNLYKAKEAMFHEFHRGFFFKETYIWKEFCLTKPIFYLRGPILTNNFTIYLKKILILKKSKPNISKQ